MWILFLYNNDANLNRGTWGLLGMFLDVAPVFCRALRYSKRSPSQPGRTTSSSHCAWDLPSFSTEGPADLGNSQSQANQTVPDRGRSASQEHPQPRPSQRGSSLNAKTAFKHKASQTQLPGVNGPREGHYTTPQSFTLRQR